MLRGFRNKTRQHGLGKQTAALEAAGASIIYDAADRDALVNSLRKGNFIVVYSLSCLATNKDDLRWVLIGQDDKAEPPYKGVFKRGAGVRILDPDQAADLHDMAHVESTLRATEDWANERRGTARAGGSRRGIGGRKPTKKTDKHTAMKAWGNRADYPTAAAALASPHMKGWSASTAARAISRGGLGPRGGLTGRLSKQIVQN